MGINLDIPHWAFLADIEIAEFDRDDLFYRIVHAHVSDHGRGHFSDDVPRSIHETKYYKPWLDLLARRRLLAKENFPHYSGFLAVELEGAKSKAMVATSFERVEDFW